MQYSGKSGKVSLQREHESSMMERSLERQIEEQRLEMLKKRIQEKLNAVPTENDKIQAA